MPPAAASLDSTDEFQAKATRAFYMSEWFEWLFLLGCLVLGFFVFQWIVPMGLSNAAADAHQQPIDIVHLVAQGDWAQFFSHFGAQPLYAILLSGVTGARTFQVGHALAVDEIYSLFVTMNLGLYWFSIFAVHWFIRRQVDKPYSYLITVLYALSPMTLSSYMALDGGLLFAILASYSLYWIDRALAKKDHPGFIKKFGDDNLSRSVVLLGLTIAASPLGYAVLAAFVIAAFCSKRVTVMEVIKSTALVMACMLPVWGWQLFCVLQGWQASWSIKLPSLGSDLITALGQIFIAITGQGGYHWLQDFPVAVMILLGWLGFGVLIGFFRNSGMAAFTLCFAGLMGALLVGPLPNTAGLFPLVLLLLYRAVLQIGIWFARFKLPALKFLFPGSTMVILALMGLGFWQAGEPAAGATNLVEADLKAALSPSGLIEKAKTLVNPAASAESNKAEGVASLWRWAQRNIPSHSRVAGLSSLETIPEAGKSYQSSDFEHAHYIIESVSKGNSPEFQSWLNRREHSVQLVYNDTWTNFQVWQVD